MVHDQNGWHEYKGAPEGETAEGSYDKEKSPFGAFALGMVFGPFGLLYVTTWKWAAVAFGALVVILIVTGGLGAPVVNAFYGGTARHLAVQHNEAIKRRRALKGNLSSSGPKITGFDAPTIGNSWAPLQFQEASVSPLFPSEANGACCGIEHPPSAKFCQSCGNAIQRKQLDTCCGSILDADAKFCPLCGTARNKSSAA